jgi:hypothetical protein
LQRITLVFWWRLHWICRLSSMDILTILILLIHKCGSFSGFCDLLNSFHLIFMNFIVDILKLWLYLFLGIFLFFVTIVLLISFFREITVVYRNVTNFCRLILCLVTSLS